MAAVNTSVVHFAYLKSSFFNLLWNYIKTVRFSSQNFIFIAFWLYLTHTKCVFRKMCIYATGCNHCVDLRFFSAVILQVLC